MSDYSQTTDFSAKDSLTTGDPEKVILGADVDVELSAISTAIASKLNTSGLLTAILGVDGAGSGIDADNVDGIGPFATTSWTPTFPTTTNLDADPTPSGTRYFRLGSVIIMWGQLTLTSSGAGTCTFTFTLPVASALAATSDLVGVMAVDGTSLHSTARIEADFTNDRGICQWSATAADAARCSFIAIYRVL